uniref:RNA helicase n=1 Tax=Heterorhabditis bacteriophora TaxID=37862 RepID=A0A1I7WZK7_HETBA
MNSVPPPSSLDLPIGQGMAGQALTSARDRDKKKEEEYANLMFYGAKTENESRRKRIYDDEYLEKDDSDDEKERGCRQYQRESEGCRITERTVGSGVYEASGKKANEDEEEDELDAFMAGIDAQVTAQEIVLDMDPLSIKASKDKAISAQKEKDRLIGKDIDSSKKGIGRADIDEEDMQESYFKLVFIELLSLRAFVYLILYLLLYMYTYLVRCAVVLKPLNCCSFIFVPVKVQEYRHLNHVETIRLRDKLGLRVGGFAPPKPVCSFAHFGFDKSLMDAIRKNEYEQPTPIQAQAIPSALIGRDVLGIAKTGSGKTAAYLWPAIVHIMDQSDLKEGEGPIAVVVVPTRELAIQVFILHMLNCVWKQIVYSIIVLLSLFIITRYSLSQIPYCRSELVICTPGRMIDLVKIGATNFLRTTFLVFDEADRMFDMGFEAQVRSISDHIRPDRQCLMFSATFKQKVIFYWYYFSFYYFCVERCRNHRGDYNLIFNHSSYCSGRSWRGNIHFFMFNIYYDSFF